MDFENDYYDELEQISEKISSLDNSDLLKAICCCLGDISNSIDNLSKTLRELKEEEDR